MSLTLTDMFCGAGGSSTGAASVGIRVRMAANHWPLAVETHNINHPDADHDCADVSQVDPRRYPSTDMLWASPECTNHSQAKGKKRNADCIPDLLGDVLPDDAATRSRATMWDVPRFAEHHKYAAVIVENVVDAARWVLFPAWWHAMECLGYQGRTVWLNSMHAQLHGLPAPQSRDRMYVVWWRKGSTVPDLARVTRPAAWCPICETAVETVQSFKREERWGRYRAQYIYRCTHCRSVVEPAWLPAASAIDWTLPGQRIGDRDKPLADKTIARIKAGLDRYWRPIHVEAGGNQYDAADPKHPQHGQPGGYMRAWPVDEPLRTLHTAMTKGVAYTPGMLVPVEGRDGKTSRPVTEPMRTMTARDETALVIPLRNHNTAKPTSEPLDTVAAAGNHHALLMPYYGHGVTRSTDQPHGTLTTRDRYALVMRNNTARGDQGQMSTPVDEPLRTLTTTGHQSLLEYDVPNVDDCLFRMLEPHEIAAGMAFPTTYTILGNKREQVRQAGNAVTPPAARDLIAVVAESLGHTIKEAA